MEDVALHQWVINNAGTKCSRIEEAGKVAVEALISGNELI